MPQGSLKEMNKGKSHVRIAVFTILAIHVAVISGLLIAGCKKDTDTAQNTTSSVPTNTPFVPAPDIAPTPMSELATKPPANGNLTPILAAPPLEAPGAPVSTTEYTVSKGETFSSIATKVGVSLKALVAANPNVDPKKLRPDQKIQIPGKSKETPPMASATSPQPAASTDNLYVVKPGDNLTIIAKAHGTTVRALRAANNLKTDQIHVGKKLKMPGKAPAGTAAGAEPVPTGAGAP